MNSERPWHVFVMGLDDDHMQDLLTIEDADRYRFHTLLEKDEIVFLDDYDIPDLIERAQRQIDNARHPVDGIIGHWDFPVTSLVPLLAQRNGLPGPSLESVCKCDDKYWSRLEQSRAIPECTPRFQLFDPFDIRAAETIELPYPFWIKPVKGFGSELGFHIANRGELEDALEETRDRIGTIGDAFNQVLDLMPVPEEIKRVGGTHCLAEEVISGRELAPEGCVYGGQVRIHGLIDMPRRGGSFERYGYPADVPHELEERICESTRRIIQHIGYDSACFNAEFFYDEATDKLWIVEINPRISQSHCYLFERVNGASNHQVAVQVATGQEPHFEPRGGCYGAAAKCMFRSWEDGRVTRMPDAQRIAEIERQSPDCRVVPKVQEGTVLHDLTGQDSFSYVLANIYACGRDQQDMLRRYEAIVEQLDIQIAPLEPAAN